MMQNSPLAQALNNRFPDFPLIDSENTNEFTLEVPSTRIKETALILRDDPQFRFEILIDVCAVDYLHYGLAEWSTTAATSEGFSRGVEQTEANERFIAWERPRFAVVYHLLSATHNQRLRIRCFLEAESLLIDSLISVWRSADWFEREAFDLYGILFVGHPDLRRILTDYGFIGHPFRKDFPISGHVEMRYDAKQQRVIYQPVSIESRTLVPKVFRSDNRYRVEDTPDA